MKLERREVICPKGTTRKITLELHFRRKLRLFVKIKINSAVSTVFTFVTIKYFLSSSPHPMLKSEMVLEAVEIMDFEVAQIALESLILPFFIIWISRKLVSPTLPALP